MAEDRFVDTPMSSEFVTSGPAGYKGSGKGRYDGDDCVPFNEYKRTSSPNGVPEKAFDDNFTVTRPEGEYDHMPETYDQSRQSDIDQGKVRR